MGLIRQGGAGWQTVSNTLPVSPIGTAEHKIADLQADIDFDRAHSTSLAFD